MGQADFTFRNETGGTIILRHELKDNETETIFVRPELKVIKIEHFIIEHLHSKTIQVDIDEPQTHEKYCVLDSADKATGKYVSSDEFKISEQVTIVKDGGEFQLKFDARSGQLWEPTRISRLWAKTREDALPTTRPSTSGGTFPHENW